MDDLELFGTFVVGALVVGAAIGVVIVLVQFVFPLVAVLGGLIAFGFLKYGQGYVMTDKSLGPTLGKAAALSVGATLFLWVGSYGLVHLVHLFKPDLYSKWVELRGGQDVYAEYGVQVIAFAAAAFLVLVVTNRLSNAKASYLWKKFLPDIIGVLVFSAIVNIEAVSEAVSARGFGSGAALFTRLWVVEVWGSIFDWWEIWQKVSSRYNEWLLDFQLDIISAKGNLFELVKLFPKCFVVAGLGLWWLPVGRDN